MQFFNKTLKGSKMPFMEMVNVFTTQREWGVLVGAVIISRHVPASVANNSTGFASKLPTPSILSDYGI